MFSCLSSKRTIKSALVVSSVFTLILLFGFMKAEHTKEIEVDDTEYRYISQMVLEPTKAGTTLRLEQIKVPVFQPELVKESQAKIYAKMDTSTPLEKGGGILILFLLMTVFLARAITGDLDEGECKEFLRQIVRKCLTFFIAVAVYLLSLYAGLEISLLGLVYRPKEKEVPAEEKKEVPVTVALKPAA